jgi:hypothetical protein
MSRLAAVAFVLVACQSGTPPSSGSAASAASAEPASADYATDVEHLCNALKYSGADQQPAGAHQMMVAQWLGPNLKTQEIHTFLARFQSLDPAAKKQALLDEARKVGLSGCPLADEWK